MVIANECTRHICCSRKNSLSCAKSTSIGRNKNKLWAGSANAQINPAVTTWGNFISGSWCGLKRVRWWSWSGSKSFSHPCLCHSFTEYTVMVSPFLLSLGNYLDNSIEFITWKVTGIWPVFCNMWIVLKRGKTRAIIALGWKVPQITPCCFVHSCFWKFCWYGPFDILDHAVQ